MKKLFALLTAVLTVSGCATTKPLPASVPVMVESAPTISQKTKLSQHWDLIIEKLNGSNVYLDSSKTSYDVFADVMKTSIIVEKEHNGATFTRHDVALKCSQRLYTETKTVYYLNPELTFTKTIDGEGSIVSFGKVGYFDVVCAMALGFVNINQGAK